MLITDQANQSTTAEMLPDRQLLIDAAILAALREPSDAVVEAAAKAIERIYGNLNDTDRAWMFRDHARAAIKAAVEAAERDADAYDDRRR